MKRILLAASLLLSTTTRAAEPDAIVARSLLAPGDPAPLHRLFAKARSGSPITLGVIGGSITEGARASAPDHRYPDLVAAHFQALFPNSKVSLVNAGVGATGSDYACLRANRDLLSHHPDLVIAEFAVNDPDTRAAAETLEGLTRQILSADNHPALLYLFTMHNDGTNAQAWHAKVGAHYHLPMVSYRDALWPEIAAKRLTWQDLSPDIVHPNDRGHAACAQFINHFLDATLADAPAAGDPPAPIPIPSPLLTDLYEHTSLTDAPALKPTKNDGWTLVPDKRYWIATQPGSTIEFDLPDAQQISAIYYRIRKNTGQVSAQIDDRPPVTLNAWTPATWGGYRDTTPLARDLPAGGPHRLKLTLLETKSPESTGHEFRLLSVAAAGTRP